MLAKEKLAAGLSRLKTLESHIKATIFVSLIVVLLIFSAPARAVVVSVATDKSTYGSGDSSAVFTVSIDIETNERVPIQNITLNITGPTNKYCVFYPNGTAISGCTNLAITPASGVPAGWDYSNMNGTGYGWNGSSWGNYTTIFGYGYGYGYSSEVSLELEYSITWNLSSENPSDGSYSAYLEARALQGSTSFTYTNQNAATFTIDRVAAASSSIGGPSGGGAAVEEAPAESPAPAVAEAPAAAPAPSRKKEQGITGAAAVSPTPPEVPLNLSLMTIASLLTAYALLYFYLRKRRKAVRKRGKKG